MIKTGSIVFFFFFLGMTQLYGQHQLELSIKGVNSSKGKIAVALYNQEDHFLDFDKAFQFASIAAASKHHEYVFNNLPEGSYAVVVFYDENSNNKIDKNFIGIPKEAIATSSTAKNKFGPPRFKNCKFDLLADKRIELQLKKIFN